MNVRKRLYRYNDVQCVLHWLQTITKAASSYNVAYTSLKEKVDQGRLTAGCTGELICKLVGWSEKKYEPHDPKRETFNEAVSHTWLIAFKSGPNSAMIVRLLRS